MPERWTAHWAHLYDEVVTSGLCTGCAGCVVACPYDVLGYNDDEGVYKPFHLEEELGPGGCGHGDRGCTSCTRACPRFRVWEPEIDQFLFGRPRSAIEVEGVTKDVILTRAADRADGMVATKLVSPARSATERANPTRRPPWVARRKNLRIANASGTGGEDRSAGERSGSQSNARRHPA